VVHGRSRYAQRRDGQRHPGLPMRIDIPASIHRKLERLCDPS